MFHSLLHSRMLSRQNQSDGCPEVRITVSLEMI